MEAFPFVTALRNCWYSSSRLLKGLSEQHSLIYAGCIGILSCLIFLLDAVTVEGKILGILYVIPLLLTIWLPSPKAPIIVGVGGLVLNALASIIDPSGTSPTSVVVFNRLIMISVLILATMLVWKVKELHRLLQEQEAEEHAQMTEKAAILDAIPAPVWIADGAGSSTITGNRAACELFDTPSDVHVTNPQHRIHSMEPETDPPPPFQVMRRAGRTGQPIINVELECRTGKGERWLYGNAIPLRDDTGMIRKVLGIFIDITELKTARNALQALNLDLERKVRERTALAEDRMKRLQTLSAELTRAEQRERRQLADELHDYFAQLLVASRLKLGQVSKRPFPAATEAVQEIDELLEKALTYTRTLIAELSPQVLYDAGLSEGLRWLSRQLKSQYAIDVEVSEEGEETRLPDDLAILLFQTIRELLMNVVKHAQVSQASVRLQYIPTSLNVVVSDKGVGFDPHASEPDPAQPGRFGLVSIRERLEALGGWFDIDSAPGRGTRSTFWIPVTSGTHQPSDKQPVVDRTRKKQGGTHVQTSSDERLRIVIADDHPIVRQGLREVLEQEPDFQVVGEASDGEEAVKQVRFTHPDTVLMDLDMPQLDGLEATRRIIQEYSDIKVIAFSALRDEELARDMKAAGAACYLLKDGRMDALPDAIRQAHKDGPAHAAKADS